MKTGTDEAWAASLRRLHESGVRFEDSSGRALVWPDEVVEQFALAGGVWYRATRPCRGCEMRSLDDWAHTCIADAEGACEQPGQNRHAAIEEKHADP